MLLGAAPAAAGIAISVEAGRGESVDVWGVGLAWTDLHTWHLGGHVDLSLSLLGRLDHWHGTEANAAVTDLWDVSATPVLRLQPAERSGVTPFLDVGIGVSLLSQTSIDSRYLSTHFQFNELIGPGVRFGGRGQYELSLRVQHTSNGDIKEPNNGLTFRTIVLQYVFR
ncbi:MAG TPA: acyloxyacyl hydrolase [Burkholderiales bacterium]|nr:acyloxyacyl hydrolase [Burkholderiales bacterium]